MPPTRLENAANRVSLTSDPARLGLVLVDGSIQVLDHSTGRRDVIIDGREGAVVAATLSEDGTCVASSSTEGVIELRHMPSGKRFARWKDNEGTARLLAFSFDGSVLASVSENGAMRVWDRSGKLLSAFRHSGVTVRSIAIGRGGRRLAIGLEDKTVQILDTRTGSKLADISGHSDFVNVLTFSPDGKRLATACRHEPVARLWDATTGEFLYSLRGHDKEVTTLVFSADGTRLASGSNDGTIRIWDSIPYRIRRLEHLASVAIKDGNPREAERLFRKALNGMRTFLGGNHPGTLGPLHGLIESLMGQKRFSEAEPLAIRCCDESKAAFGELHAAVRRSVRNLVDIYEALGRPRPAAKLRTKPLG